MLKGVGKVYLQTAIDCHSRHAWARLYPNKLPVTAVQLMNNDVLATFEAHGARIDTVLSDNGREFCGRDDRHPYELFLQLEGIAHKRTRVSRPQANGIVERLHRTPCSTNTFASKAAEPGFPTYATRGRSHKLLRYAISAGFVRLGLTTSPTTFKRLSAANHLLRCKRLTCLDVKGRDVFRAC